MTTAGHSDPWLFVDGGRIREHELVQLVETVHDIAPVEYGDEFGVLSIKAAHDPQIAIVDLALIVVLDWHDFVAWGEGRAETLDAVVTWWIQRCLQFEIERARAEPPVIHRAEHLNVRVPDRRQSVAESALERAAAASHLVRVHRFDEEEVGAVVCGELWHERD